MLPAKSPTLTRRSFFQALINGALLVAGTASALRSATGKPLELPRASLPQVSPLETFVAGSVYYDAPEVRDLLVPGNKLILSRQPSNPHDQAAIEVFTTGGKKLGYVPRVDNPPFADLMDAGRKVLAEVIDVDLYRYDDIQIRLTFGL